MSANTVVHVDFRTQPVYEIAGSVVASLLYSEPRDTDDDRAHALTVLGARALLVRAQRDPAWANAPTQARPFYAMTSVDEINRSLVDINRRLRRRWIAGEMILPFLEIAATGQCPAMERLAGKATVNRVAALVLDKAPESSVEDVKKRIWAPSKPVLHLAAAFSFEKYTREMRGEKFDFDDFFWDPMFVLRVIVAAEFYQPLLEKSIAAKKMAIDPATLIRIQAAAA